MLITIINQSSLLSDEQVILMSRAIQAQVNLHLLPAFNLKCVNVKFYSDLTKIPGHAWVICLTDDSLNQKEIQNNFQFNNDTVNVFIYCKPIFDNNGSVSVTLSHEVCEMITNRFNNIWITGPDTIFGNQYAYEICDPVEEDHYPIAVDNAEILVSNFVFPSFFNLNASAILNMPFDYLKILTAPFTTSIGGSLMIRKSNEDCHCLENKVSEWKRQFKKSFRKNRKH